MSWVCALVAGKLVFSVNILGIQLLNLALAIWAGVSFHVCLLCLDPNIELCTTTLRSIFDVLEA